MRALFDLHMHTLVSDHTFSILEENTEGVGWKSLWTISTSDHAEKMPGANPNAFVSYRVVQKSVGGVRVFYGIEASICDFDGMINIGESLLQKMDYVIASLHTPCIQSGIAEQNTAALIGAVKNTCVKIIAHPDDSQYPLDYEALVQAAKELGAALGFDSSSLIPDSIQLNGRKNAEMPLNTCKRFEAPVILGSGAYI